MNNYNFAIIVTCFNRKQITISSLNRLFDYINEIANATFDCYLVDDGTDGTGIAVKEHFPKIFVIKGTGNLFWGGGMNLAWREAQLSKQYDGYIWFNDDVKLYPGSLLLLLQPYFDGNRQSIISGACCSRLGVTTYGGRSDEKSIQDPNGTYQTIKLLNGNFSFIPKEVFDTIGFIDSTFRHGVGDFDYGLRAQHKGFKLLLTPRYIGECERHDEVIPRCFDKSIRLAKRIKILHSPFYNPSSYFRYNLRHKGIANAVIVYIYTYVRCYFPFIFYKH